MSAALQVVPVADSAAAAAPTLLRLMYVQYAATGNEAT